MVKMDVDGSCQLSADSQPKSSNDVSLHSIQFQRRRLRHGQVCLEVLRATGRTDMYLSVNQELSTQAALLLQRKRLHPGKIPGLNYDLEIDSDPNSDPESDVDSNQYPH